MEKTCPICNSKFQGYKKTDKYCSKQCRQIAMVDMARQWRIRKGLQVEQKYCLYCHKEIDSQKKFCSSKCRYKYRHRKLYVRTCPVCNKTFETNSGVKIYCSVECRKQYTADKKTEKAKLKEEKKKASHIAICQACGNEFIVTSNRAKLCPRCRNLKGRYPNRCQLCGGIMNGENYVICKDCFPFSKLKIPKDKVYMGTVVEKIFPIGGEKY